MKIFSLVLFLFLTTAPFIQAQEKDMNLFRKKITEGSHLLLEENYSEALRSFREAYNIDSSSANINFRLGYSYLNSAAEKKKAVHYLEQAMAKVVRNYDEFNPREEGAPVIAYYYLAQAYHLHYRFDEAISYYDRFLAEIGTKNKKLVEEVNQKKQISVNGSELIRKPVEIILTNLKEPVNSPFPEYSPVLTADESMIIFTSRKEGSTGGEKEFNGMYYEDIYVSYKGKDGKWSAPVSIGPNINTNGHEAAVGLSPDGQQLLIYKDDGGDGNLYISRLEGDTWLAPEKLGSDINTPAWEPSASLSADGNILYFISDRKGGYGGKDIWRCVRFPDGKWSLALNLGPTVNTAYNEEAPFIHPDGVTMFFSSEGHKTMGGYDIFYSKLNEETHAWSAPVNIGYPINTTDDDVFYIISADGKRSYYSSAQAGGLGEKDIYMISLPEAVVDPVVILKGHILMDDSNRLPPNTRILVTDLETGEIVQENRPNSKTGRYLVVLSPGQKGKIYYVNYEADGMKPIFDSIIVEPLSKYREYEREIDLEPIEFTSKRGFVVVKGSMKNKDGKVLPKSKIVVKDNTTGELAGIYYPNPQTGNYMFNIEKGKNYNVSYEADNYLFRSENITHDKKKQGDIVRDIVLDDLKSGASIVLNNLFFDYNKSTLRPASKVELGKLYKFLQNNPGVKVEIAGHTDSKGKDDFNQKLSEMRAQSVVSFLVSKGIDNKRLTAKGYGESTPLAREILPNGKPDPKGMQQNRRVELKILD